MLKDRKKILLVVAAAFCLVVPVFFALGDYVDDLSKQIQEQEAKRQELEQKAKEYQEIIDQKKGEIKSLSNQVAIFNAQIGKLETEIRITEDDISQTQLEIVQLTFGIGETEVDMMNKKVNLGKIIQSIAECDQTSDLEMILQSDDFSDFFSQLTYLENLQGSVQKEVERLKVLKQKLSQDKESKEDKKQRLEELNEQLNEQKWSLSGQRKAKETVLKYTQGEEAKYQKMLANIEAQKRTLLGDIDRLRQLKTAELAKLKEAQEKPAAGYWASTNWYFKQDDPRWANTTIGISDSKMKNYGCAITSVAMVFDYHGANITPGQLAKESIYAWDLIYWPKRWEGLQCANCPPPHSSVFDWFKLDRELGAGYPVIVFVRAEGRGAGHYVVVHHKTADGRYVVHDPLFGANIYLSSTQAYIGVLYNTTTRLDQMVIYH